MFIAQCQAKVSISINGEPIFGSPFNVRFGQPGA
jgi:hypothetical protein